MWASAHTCQFSEVGWRIPFQSAGALSSGGSYLTLIAPNSSDFSVVIETASARCHRCPGFSFAAQLPQLLKLSVPRLLLESSGPAAASVGSPSLYVWSTNQTHQFQQLPPLQPEAAESGATTLVLSLRVQPQSLYTVTTTTGQTKGSFAGAVPASFAFPSTWKDGFDDRLDESLGKFFADQCGSFQVMPHLDPRGGGKALRQRVTVKPGVNSWDGNLDSPLTVIGDANPATNVYKRTSISVRLWLPPAPPATLSSAQLLLPPTKTHPIHNSQAPPSVFVPHAQNRLFGRGYWQLEGNFTLAEAEAKCLADVRCKAITMASPTLPAAGESLQMWLTADVAFFASAGWQTYLLQGTTDHPTQSAWRRKRGAGLAVARALALPMQAQLDFQSRELTQFMHLSVSTFAPINCTNGTRCVVKEPNCLDATNNGSGSEPMKPLRSM